ETISYEDLVTTGSRNAANEKDNSYHLKLEVPGMEAKDLDIQVMADRVAIFGERKSETKSEENGETRLCGAVSFRAKTLRRRER
ncbi:MAG: Hsp20/alpha crystallin family protein, partial [Cyanobacteria bacterium J06598_4]